MTDQVAPPTGHGLSDRIAVARRRGLDPQERRRVMDAVALRRDRSWRTQFGILQALSVTVAVMGLSLNSPAVVIGAMLLAPLMVPVLGIAAALSMALSRHLMRSLGIVILASLGSIVLAYLLAMMLPSGQLSTEVLARTSPDLRDLVVALAAGAAGAYATVRSDVSTSLPGVAVAVALVPPLATIGITLEAGRSDLTEGAALLYAANLTAIILIGVGVFVLTGFAPPRRFRQTRLHVASGALLVAAATAAVAVPLTVASVSASQSGRDRDLVRTAAAAWVQGTGDEIDEVRIDETIVRIRVSGPTSPPPTADLERRVRQVLGPAAVVEVRWTQTQAPPSEAPDQETTDAIFDAQRRETVIRERVEIWLENGSYEIDRLDIETDEIRIDLISADPPPPVDELTDRLFDEIGGAVPVVVNWTQRTTLRPGDGVDEANSVEQVRRSLELATRDWARSIEGIVVETVGFDGSMVTVDLVGPEPVDIADLERVLRELAPDETAITVWFIERRQLLPTTTTITPTTTTTTITPTTTIVVPSGTDAPTG